MATGDDFDLTPPAPLEWHGKGPAPKKETRSEAWKRRAGVRRQKMRLRYGPGPEGRTCKPCQFLIRVGHHDGAYLKCEKAGISSSEATDWRAGWPACGAYVHDGHTKEQ